MADRIRINTDRLGIDDERIQACITSLVKEINNMKQSVYALERMWEGDGKDAFHKTFMDDIKAAEQAVNSLKSMYAYDRNAKQQYELCERKIASLIADIRV